jgi:tRNA-dihydrouridine synthase B
LSRGKNKLAKNIASQYKPYMTETQLLNALRLNPFLMAPMAGITDKVFRLFMKQQGAGVLISELISANGFKYNSEKTKKMMEFFAEESPVGIQIFGEEEEALVQTAQYVEQIGADFVDINLGCPVKKIVKKGAGSALLREPEKLARIFKQIKNKINIPLTIKIRTGWDQENRNALEIVNIAYNEGVTWVAIHGRTRSQAYLGKADWEFIKEIKSKSPLPIIGNGDIHTAEKAVERLQESHCDGVMIGRGCLKNPWIFSQAQKIWSGKDFQPISNNYLPLFEFILEKSQGHFEENYQALILRKLANWYSSGLPGSGDFRRSIFQARGLSETMQSINQYYSSLNPESRLDTSSEKFLMGGHG